MVHDGNHRGEQAIQLTPEKEVIFNRARLVNEAAARVKESLGRAEETFETTAAIQNPNSTPVSADTVIDARVRFETARLAAEAEKQFLNNQANQARTRIDQSYQGSSQGAENLRKAA